MRKKAGILIAIVCVLSLGMCESHLLPLYKTLHKRVWGAHARLMKKAEKKQAEQTHKAIAGAIEMYCLDFNVSVSKLDLQLMQTLQNEGYLGKLPDGVSSIAISPQGEMKYIGTDGNVMGNFQQSSWFAQTPDVPSALVKRAFEPSIAELGDITPFFATCVKKTSTFCVDVDTASYSVAVDYLENGQLPAPENVRVEEFLNAFPQGYDTQSYLPSGENEDFSLYCDGGPSPYGGVHMLRLGLKARDVVEVERKQPLLITLVVDSSGSMNGNNRLGMLQQTIPELMNRLSKDDKVAIIAYSNSARTLLEPCFVKDHEKITKALDSIRADGGTNIESGIVKGYEMAALHNTKDVTSIVVLFSDGVSNKGELNADALMENVKNHAEDGILLNTIGVGMGTYNDAFLERLACRGNGMYAYMNNDETAADELGKCIRLTSAVVGRNVRMNVEFDPVSVKRYRLIGYDNRDKGEMNVKNTKEEAGEVFANTQTAVIYEVELTKAAQMAASDGTLSLGSATVHYLSGDGSAKQATAKLYRSSLCNTPETSSFHFRLAAAVAEFAEILRESPFARGRDLSSLRDRAQTLSDEEPGDSLVANLVALIESAMDIKVKTEKTRQIARDANCKGDTIVMLN